MEISLRLLYRPIEQQLPIILNNQGIDYDRRVIPSIGQEVLKSIVAQYNAEQLLTQREKVSEEIKEDLSKRAADFNLLIDDVSITHLKFSDDFGRAIEDKQIAQQMAERAKFVVMRREEEMKAAILRAEGESEAAELIANAINESGPGKLDGKLSTCRSRCGAQNRGGTAHCRAASADAKRDVPVERQHDEHAEHSGLRASGNALRF